MRFAPLMLALFAAAPAVAQEPAADPRCAGPRSALPAELAAWATRAPLNAGVGLRSAPVLVVGRGSDLKLTAADQVTLSARPEKPAETGEMAGLALFQVTRAGTYRVALGAPAWIDVVRAGRALPSVLHGHGPACSGVRKMVDFRLMPGRYVLQLTRTQMATVPVMIVRAPAGARA